MEKIGKSVLGKATIGVKPDKSLQSVITGSVKDIREFLEIARTPAEALEEIVE